MLYSRSLKPYLCTAKDAKDGSRRAYPAMSNVMLARVPAAKLDPTALNDAPVPCLIATDGHRLTLVPVELEEGDTDGLLPMELLKAAKPNHAGWVSIKTNGSISAETKAGRVTMPRPEGEYPRYETVIPDRSSPPLYRIGLNAELLAGIQATFGGGSVVLEVRDPEGKGPIVVEVHSEYGGRKEGLGILMPATISE